MKEWRGFALSVCIGLITGGGVTAAVGAARLNTAKLELRAEIADVRDDGDATHEAVIELAVAMARVEEQLKAANAKLDAMVR